jgi:hypothetical protein
MKNYLIILTIAFASNLIAIGQTVSLSDSIFNIGDKLPIRPIHFDLAKSNILTDSYPYLDSIADFLVKNKNLSIEVGVHTDNRWSDKFSTCLSCNRAKAIVNYLISKGIQPDRLHSKGYNDKEPLVSDEEIIKLKTIEEKEKAHQINRRTEFKIISTDYASKTIDFANLNEVKVTLEGQWYRFFQNDTIIETFKFYENSFKGECKSKSYISTAPVFTLIRQDNKTIIRWYDITGGEFDYVILELTKEKMTVQYNEKKIEYRKNAL